MHQASCEAAAQALMTARTGLLGLVEQVTKPVCEVDIGTAGFGAMLG
jgi:hypothetical protein